MSSFITYTFSVLKKFIEFIKFKNGIKLLFFKVLYICSGRCLYPLVTVLEGLCVKFSNCLSAGPLTAAFLNLLPLIVSGLPTP